MLPSISNLMQSFQERIEVLLEQYHINIKIIAKVEILSCLQRYGDRLAQLNLMKVKPISFTNSKSIVWLSSALIKVNHLLICDSPRDLEGVWKSPDIISYPQKII